MANLRRLRLAIATAALGALAIGIASCAESPTDPVPRPGASPWNLLNPGPVTTDFQDVWADDAHDIWAAGGSTLVRSDGQALVTWRNPLGTDLRAISGFARDDVYAVGAAGTLLHFDGGRWLAVSTGTDRDLEDILCLDSGVVIVVGDGVSLRRVGGAWSPLALPPSVHLTSVWQDLDGEDATLYAAGPDGVYRDGGAGWVPDIAPAGVSFSHGDGHWALVDDGATVYRRDDAGWHWVADLPGGVRAASLLADADSLTLGITGSIATGTPPAGLFTVWSGPGRVIRALAMVGQDPHQVVAAGNFGTLLLDRDPSRNFAWATFSSGVGFSAASLQGLTCTNLVGRATDTTHVLRYNGTAWSAEDPQLGVPIAALWAGPGGVVTVVGAGGRIARRTPVGAWQPQTTSTGADLAAVWGARSTDVFAGGAGGLILHYDGAAWQPMLTLGTADIVLLCGTGGDRVWAFDRAGAIHFYNGNFWATQVAAGPRTFEAVTVLADGATIVVAGVDTTTTDPVSHTLWQLTDSGLEALTPTATIPGAIHALSGTALDDLWAAGEAGLYHGDGTTWHADTHLDGAVSSVWTGPGCGVYAATAAGIYWRPEP